MTTSRRKCASPLRARFSRLPSTSSSVYITADQKQSLSQSNIPLFKSTALDSRSLSQLLLTARAEINCPGQPEPQVKCASPLGWGSSRLPSLCLCRSPCHCQSKQITFLRSNISLAGSTTLDSQSFMSNAPDRYGRDLLAFLPPLPQSFWCTGVPRS